MLQTIVVRSLLLRRVMQHCGQHLLQKQQHVQTTLTPTYQLDQQKLNFLDAAPATLAACGAGPNCGVRYQVDSQRSKDLHTVALMHGLHKQASGIA